MSYSLAFACFTNRQKKIFSHKLNYEHLRETRFSHLVLLFFSVNSVQITGWKKTVRNTQNHVSVKPLEPSWAKILVSLIIRKFINEFDSVPDENPLSVCFLFPDFALREVLPFPQCPGSHL